MLLSSKNSIDSRIKNVQTRCRNPKHLDFSHIICVIHVFLSPGHLPPLSPRGWYLSFCNIAIFPLYDVVKKRQHFLVKILFRFCCIIILLYKIDGRRFSIHQLVVVAWGGKSTRSSSSNVAGKWLALGLSHLDKPLNKNLGWKVLCFHIGKTTNAAFPLNSAP